MSLEMLGTIDLHREVIALATVGASLFLGVLLTFLVRRGARRVGLFDRPDGFRKLHREPVPLGGGLAIYVAMAAVVGALCVLPHPWRKPLHDYAASIWALMLAGGVIVLVGLADDRFRLRGRVKLLGQGIAAAVLIAGGFLIEGFEVFGYTVDLGLLAVPFTLFWLLGAINAINLLDGVDGLAALVGLILVSTVGVMGVMTHNVHVFVIALALGGSLTGFLWFNLPPASIFLGDAGSMLIGLLIGGLSIQGSFRGPGTVLLAAPLAALTIPVLDSAAALIRRKLTGRSVYAADRAHLHHRLLYLFGSNGKVLACVAVLCGVTCVGALVSLFFKTDWVAVVVGSGVLSVFLVTNMFGRVELLILASRAKQFGLSFLSPTALGGPPASHASFQLQGSREWGTVWRQLMEAAREHSLGAVRLDIHMPWVREGFHGSWQQAHQETIGRCWRLEIPLVHQGEVVGTLKIVGPQDEELRDASLERMPGVLEPILGSLEALLREGASAGPRTQVLTAVGPDAGALPNKGPARSAPPRRRPK